MSKIKNSMISISRKLTGWLFPSLVYSQYRYEEHISSEISGETHWLDLGCGHQVLPDWREKVESEMVNKCKSVAGIDFDMHSLTNHKTIDKLVRGFVGDTPFRNESFDLISSNMVVEHLEKPERVFNEAFRILKPNGKFVFHTPNISGYNTIAARLIPEFIKPKLAKLLHGRAEEDIFLTHYKCNNEKMIRQFAEEAGLEIVSIKYILSTPQFMVFPPLVIFELLWLNILRLGLFRKFRVNILATLTKSTSSD